MKKLLFVTFICISLCFTAKAQSKFSLGPSAGLGHSWISNADGAKFKLAANAGLSLVYSASEHFGIGLDAKYSFEGLKSTLSSIYGTTSTSFDLNYFRFPLKAIYFFNTYGNKFRPKVFAGPSFGFLSTAKVSDTDVKNAYNSSDIGLTAGAGFNYRLVKNTWFNADLNYLHGFSNILKNSSEKARNRNIGINVGVNFGL